MQLIKRMNVFKKEHEGHFKESRQGNIGNPHSFQQEQGGYKQGYNNGPANKLRLKDSQPFNPNTAQSQLQNYGNGNQSGSQGLLSNLSPNGAPYYQGNQDRNYQKQGGYSNYNKSYNQPNGGQGQANDKKPQSNVPKEGGDNEEFVQTFSLTGGHSYNGHKKNNNNNAHRKRNNNQ